MFTEPFSRIVQIQQERFSTQNTLLSIRRVRIPYSQVVVSISHIEFREESALDSFSRRPIRVYLVVVHNRYRIDWSHVHAWYKGYR